MCNDVVPQLALAPPPFQSLDIFSQVSIICLSLPYQADQSKFTKTNSSQLDTIACMAKCPVPMFTNTKFHSLQILTLTASLFLPSFSKASVFPGACLEICDCKSFLTSKESGTQVCFYPRSAKPLFFQVRVQHFVIANL